MSLKTLSSSRRMSRFLPVLLWSTVLPLTALGPATAAEGMWTFDNPPLQRMQKEIGWSPTPTWLNHAMHASARLAFGCSGSFVSGNGLVLTNHHCASQCVEQLSNAKVNYLDSGFLARDNAEEQRCPAMEVNRLEAITDVTATMRKATQGLEGEAFTRAKDGATAKLSSECAAAEGKQTRCDVVDLYHGGQFHLYRYHRFQDVRLVFVPELAAAFFGGDPDNFNFPRFDLDMALLRVYEDGKPVKITDFFPVNPSGPVAGEPVFTTGHPGSTQRSFTVSQLDNLRDHRLPANLMRLSEYRGLLNQYRTSSPQASRYAGDELFFTENSFKALRGEREALTEPALMRAKQADETALKAYVNKNPELQRSTGAAWDAIDAAVRTAETIGEPFRQIERAEAFNSHYFEFARTLLRGSVELDKPDADRLREFSNARLPEIENDLFSTAPVYPAFEKVKLGWSLTKMREELGTNDPLVRQILGNESPQQVADRMIDQTTLGDLETRKRLWKDHGRAVASATDPFIKLAMQIEPVARAMRKDYETRVTAVIEKNNELLAAARFAMAGTGTYPDATFTLRLSYGAVQGWTERGTAVSPFTDYAGAFGHATGADPFKLPASWLSARNKLNLATPLNFSSSNDIIGGNSGSPVINREGQLVGLIFDGNIHSLGGAFGFDPASNRAVSVDSAALLEALTTIYHAPWLSTEMRGTAVR